MCNLWELAFFTDYCQDAFLSLQATVSHRSRLLSAFLRADSPCLTLSTSSALPPPVRQHLECVAHRHDRDIQTETALLRRGQGEVARTLM